MHIQIVEKFTDINGLISAVVPLTSFARISLHQYMYVMLNSTPLLGHIVPGNEDGLWWFVDIELASQRLPESFCVPNLLYRSCYAIYKNSDKLNTSVRATHT